MSQSTAERILDAAQTMAQTRGFHDFSYRDVAAEVGVKSASVHYHFPTKGQLGAALVKRYRSRFAEALAAVPKRAGAVNKLSSFADLFRTALTEGRVCLCGALGAEVGGLPEPTAEEVSRFFTECEIWLADVLVEGREARALRFSSEPEVEAFAYLSLLEGAVLVARNLNDRRRFDAAVESYLAGLQS